ncbi:hypothetical protein AAHE18_17G118900 [Arachis hypogaea]
MTMKLFTVPFWLVSLNLDGCRVLIPVSPTMSPWIQLRSRCTIGASRGQIPMISERQARIGSLLLLVLLKEAS